MLGSLILYLKGMRIMMFRFSGFCYKPETPHPKTWTLIPNMPSKVAGWQSAPVSAQRSGEHPQDDEVLC